MNDCIFCKIINGEIPSEKVFESEYVTAFTDIKPQAPVHIVIVPKEHIKNVAEINEDNASVIGEIMLAAAKIAKSYHLDSGYRIITNIGSDGGQTVEHLHFHLLGGKKLGEKII